MSAADFEQRVREAAKVAHRDLWSLLRPLCKIWREAVREAEALRKRIEAQSRQETVIRRLMIVPGFGLLVATAFIATIDDPGRFQQGDQVAAYLGLTPAVHQFGETEYHGRITNPLLADIQGRKKLIIQGHGGRSLLADTLGRERVAHQSPTRDVYQRSCLDVDASSLMQTWKQKIDVFIATSNAVIDNLHNICGYHPVILQTPLVVISQRM